jgi:hypothetical protein
MYNVILLRVRVTCYIVDFDLDTGQSQIGGERGILVFHNSLRDFIRIWTRASQ